MPRQSGFHLFGPLFKGLNLETDCVEAADRKHGISRRNVPHGGLANGWQGATVGSGFQ